MHHLTTMKLGACVGYTGNVTPHRSKISNHKHDKSNDGTFFYKNNYRWIIKCLDDGYTISSNLLEYMGDYCHLLQVVNKQHNTYASKWKSKIQHQSTLSSYNTTKRAQIQTINSSAQVALLNKTRYDAIQQVIHSYKKRVNIMFPRELLNPVRKHYRSKEMERLFKDAYSPLRKVSDELDQLHKQEQQANDVLRNAEAEYRNLKLDETTSKTKLSQAKNSVHEKRGELKTIQNDVTQAEENYAEAQKTYRQVATDIYLKCRDLEEERLNQIRETLMEFTQAIHSTNFATEQTDIYNNLLSHIESQQNTLADLNFWARAYKVNDSISSETDESDDDPENSDHDSDNDEH